jgi:hypothetical protein
VERIERLIGVYDADGSLLGELSYVVGHALGRRSCALCDITHGRLRRRHEFDAALARLDVRVDLMHRDEQPTELADLTVGALPCVVAETRGGRVVLVGADALKACAGDPRAFVDAVHHGARAQGLLPAAA